MRNNNTKALFSHPFSDFSALLEACYSRWQPLLALCSSRQWFHTCTLFPLLFRSGGKHAAVASWSAWSCHRLFVWLEGWLLIRGEIIDYQCVLDGSLMVPMSSDYICRSSQLSYPSYCPRTAGKLPHIVSLKTYWSFCYRVFRFKIGTATKLSQVSWATGKPWETASIAYGSGFYFSKPWAMA